MFSGLATPVIILEYFSQEAIWGWCGAGSTPNHLGYLTKYRMPFGRTWGFVWSPRERS